MRTLHWKEALPNYNRELRLQRLQPELLNGGVVYVTKDGTQIELDKGFAFYRMIEAFFRPLGLIVGEKIRKDYITKVFIPECIAFYEKEGTSFFDRNLRRIAELMSRVNRLSVEENLRLLLETSGAVAEEEEEE